MALAPGQIAALEAALTEAASYFDRPPSEKGGGRAFRYEGGLDGGRELLSYRPQPIDLAAAATGARDATLNAALSGAFATFAAAARALLRGICIGAGLDYERDLAPYVDAPLSESGSALRLQPPHSQLDVIRYAEEGYSRRHFDASLVTIVYSPGIKFVIFAIAIATYV